MIIMIYNKKLDDIGLEDIKMLISQEIIEDKSLEYKEEMNNGEKDKILKTICGFSNANGGLFIYGLKEEDGKPLSINGISLDDNSWDDKKRTVLSWIETNIEPKVYVDIKHVKLENNNILILIKVPKSWTSPHCVKLNNGVNRSFYIRRDGSTTPMEFQEIETMFNSKNTVMDKINEFRDKRINKFASENKDKFRLILHVIPLDSFFKDYININEAADILSQTYRRDKNIIGDISIIGGTYNPNFDGIYRDYEHSYYSKRLFRNGIFEIKRRKSNDSNILLEYYQNECVDATKEIFEMYHKLDVFSPIVLFVSLINIVNHRLEEPSKFYGMGKYHAAVEERNILNPSGVIIENEEQIDDRIHNLFIPLWNHYGIAREYK